MAFPLEFFLTQAFRYTLMPKDKKKHAKKDELSDDILDVAHASLKKFRKVTKEIGKLSTGQKLVGGIALLAAGLTYLAKQQADEATAGDASTSATLLESGHKRKKSSSFASE